MKGADKFVTRHIMKLYEEDDDDVIRETVRNSMRVLAVGQGKAAGQPRRMIELLGLKDDEDEAPERPDIGEL